MTEADSTPSTPRTDSSQLATHQGSYVSGTIHDPIMMRFCQLWTSGRRLQQENEGAELRFRAHCTQFNFVDAIALVAPTEMD